MRDLEARCLLTEKDDAKRQAGIGLLYERFRRPLMAYLRDSFPDLSADERATSISEVFTAIYDKAADGSLETNAELSGLIFTIAKRRALDLRRKNRCRIPEGSKLLEDVGDYLKETEIGSDWRHAAILEKTQDVADEFRQFVGTLKAPQQKRVASVMADALPDWLTDREIADEVNERFGINVSQVEVKGAKQAFINKFREVLKRRIK